MKCYFVSPAKYYYVILIYESCPGDHATQTLQINALIVEEVRKMKPDKHEGELIQEAQDSEELKRMVSCHRMARVLTQTAQGKLPHIQALMDEGNYRRGKAGNI